METLKAPDTTRGEIDPHRQVGCGETSADGWTFWLAMKVTPLGHVIRIGVPQQGQKSDGLNDHEQTTSINNRRCGTEV
jgi:hypothetical protein